MQQTTLHPHISRYISERLQRGEIVAATARSIRNHLQQFAQFYGRRPTSQLGPKTVEQWIAAMHKQGLAPSTQALRLSTLRTFAKWAVLKGITKKDWTANAPKISRPRQVPHDMTNEHVAAVMAEADNPRDTVIMWLMFGCGLRCVEVSRLNIDDYDRVTRQLYIVGKGGHVRFVPVPEPTRQAIADYLAWAGHATGAMIRCLDRPGRLGPERISGRIGMLTRRAGIRVRPGDGRGAHGFRAAAASDLYEACGDPLVVQEFLGHASLATGAVYLRRAQTSRVADAQDARPWAELEAA